MVLCLKVRKSRSSPGIEASGSGYNPFTKSTGLTRKGGPFGVFSLGSRCKIGIAGWSSPVARQAHNLKVVGSNPTPATTVKTHITSDFDHVRSLAVGRFLRLPVALARGHLICGYGKLIRQLARPTSRAAMRALRGSNPSPSPCVTPDRVRTVADRGSALPCCATMRSPTPSTPR